MYCIVSLSKDQRSQMYWWIVCLTNPSPSFGSDSPRLEVFQFADLRTLCIGLSRSNVHNRTDLVVQAGVNIVFETFSIPILLQELGTKNKTGTGVVEREKESFLSE